MITRSIGIIVSYLNKGIQMNSSYKINITEGEKSIKCEVTVENPSKEDVIKEAKEIFEEMSKYTKAKTLIKVLEK
jgi:hypothetical protein